MMANMIKALKRSGPQSKRLLEQLMETGKLTGQGAMNVGKAGGAAGLQAAQLGGKKMGSRLKEAGMLTGEGLGQVFGAGGSAAKQAFKQNPYGAAALGAGGAAGAGGLAALLASLGEDEDEDM